MPLSCGQNFYPRPLRGGRPTREYYYSGREQFLSTPSARRATPAFGTRIPKPGVFLSTPSARRATAPIRQSASLATNFYPRPLRGGRPDGPVCIPYRVDFYPRPLRGGRLWIPWYLCFPRQFLSTPSARRATGGLAGDHHPLRNFYPRPPRGGRRACNYRAS